MHLRTVGLIFSIDPLFSSPSDTCIYIGIILANIGCYRWRIVIHGGVDGFSRTAVFIHASDNNRQDTVLQQFLAAAATFGLPSRIRVDDGGENNAICNVMELLHGEHHKAAIRGSSVHNQRIERFWRDLWFGVTNTFHSLFHFLEHSNYLNCDDEQHVWALHYVFLPRINTALKKFQQQWNNHGLRTEHNRTPQQLFVGQALRLCNSSLTAVRELFYCSNANVGLSIYLLTAVIVLSLAQILLMNRNHLFLSLQ